MDDILKSLVSWDGKENLQDHRYLRVLEKHLAGGLAFSSNQAAITACLETLGSRFQPISVIMPVTASYDALMGVIRANARPVVTDVDEYTFQADANQVKEAIKSLPEAVVYLHRPGGLPVSGGLLEAVQDVPTICDTRVLPVEQVMTFTFNIYDLSVVVGEGSVLYHKNEEQLKDLRQVRADSKTELSEINAALVYKRQPQISVYPTGSIYAQLLDNSSKSGIIGYTSGDPTATYLIQVKDANRVLTHAAQLGVQLGYGCIPVYKYQIARRRWVQEPNYPVAEKLHKELVLLPNHENVDRKVLLEAIWNIVT